MKKYWETVLPSCLVEPSKYSPLFSHPARSFLLLLHTLVVAMHPSRSQLHVLSAAITITITITLLLICYFTLLPFVTAGSSDNAGYQQRKMVLGSRPPHCINKCLACKPCLPTLVVQGHQLVKKTSSSRDNDDGYYLLVWKCICGNNLFHP